MEKTACGAWRVRIPKYRPRLHRAVAPGQKTSPRNHMDGAFEAARAQCNGLIHASQAGADQQYISIELGTFQCRLVPCEGQITTAFGSSSRQVRVAGTEISQCKHDLVGHD